MGLHIEQEGLHECPGATLTVSDKADKEKYSYDGDDFHQANCDIDGDGNEDCHAMYTMSISDDTVIVTLDFKQAVCPDVNIRVDGYWADLHIESRGGGDFSVPTGRRRSECGDSRDF